MSCIFFLWNSYSCWNVCATFDDATAFLKVKHWKEIFWLYTGIFGYQSNEKEIIFAIRIPTLGNKNKNELYTQF